MTVMSTTEPRVSVPEAVAAGEIFAVKALITHVMETGLRHDEQGNLIPRRIINKFTCLHAGVLVFSADFHESVAANPFVEFRLRGTHSGKLEFVWEEDGGAVYRLEHQLQVG